MKIAEIRADKWEQAFTARVRVFIKGVGDIYMTTSLSCHGGFKQASRLFARIYGPRNVLSIEPVVASDHEQAAVSPMNPITASFRKALTGSSGL